MSRPIFCQSGLCSVANSQHQKKYLENIFGALLIEIGANIRFPQRIIFVQNGKRYLTPELTKY
jgi:hypothetical protein